MDKLSDLIQRCTESDGVNAALRASIHGTNAFGSVTAHYNINAGGGGGGFHNLIAAAGSSASAIGFSFQNNSSGRNNKEMSVEEEAYAIISDKELWDELRHELSCSKVFTNLGIHAISTGFLKVRKDDMDRKTKGRNDSSRSLGPKRPSVSKSTWSSVVGENVGLLLAAEVAPVSAPSPSPSPPRPTLSSSSRLTPSPPKDVTSTPRPSMKDMMGTISSTSSARSVMSIGVSEDGRPNFPPPPLATASPKPPVKKKLSSMLPSKAKTTTKNALAKVKRRTTLLSPSSASVSPLPQHPVTRRCSTGSVATMLETSYSESSTSSFNFHDSFSLGDALILPSSNHQSQPRRSSLEMETLATKEQMAEKRNKEIHRGRNENLLRPRSPHITRRGSFSSSTSSLKASMDQELNAISSPSSAVDITHHPTPNNKRRSSLVGELGDSYHQQHQQELQQLRQKHQQQQQQQLLQHRRALRERRRRKTYRSQFANDDSTDDEEDEDAADYKDDLSMGYPPPSSVCNDYTYNHNPKNDTEQQEQSLNASKDSVFYGWGCQEADDEDDAHTDEEYDYPNHHKKNQQCPVDPVDDDDDDDDDGNLLVSFPSR